MFTKKKCIVVLLGVFALYLYGCGDGHVIPTSEQSFSGMLAQGYVDGATVWADKLTTATTGNFVVDTGEVTAEGNSVDGAYSMTIPENYGSYVIVSQGGFVEDSSGVRQPAVIMMAPAPAASEGTTITVNVTPVTTLVALEPALADKIEYYDADIADGAVNADLVQLAKTVESVLFLLTNPETGVVDAGSLSAQMEVVGEIAEAIDDNVDEASGLGDFLDNESDFADKIQEAVGSGLGIIEDEWRDDVVVDERDTFLSHIGTAVEEVSIVIQAASPGGIVTESEVLKDVEDKVGDAKDDIAVVVKSTSVTIDPDPDLSYDSYMYVTFVPVNDTEIVQSYTGALLKVTINDDPKTARTLVVEYTGLSISISISNNITIAPTVSSKVLVTGESTTGTIVNMSLGNASDVDHYFEMSDNVMKFDLSVLEEEIEAMDPDSILLDISEAGEYTLNIERSGFPLVPKSFNLTVVEE